MFYAQDTRIIIKPLKKIGTKKTTSSDSCGNGLHDIYDKSLSFNSSVFCVIFHCSKSVQTVNYAVNISEICVNMKNVCNLTLYSVNEAAAAALGVASAAPVTADEGEKFSCGYTLDCFYDWSTTCVCHECIESVGRGKLPVLICQHRAANRGTVFDTFCSLADTDAS